MSRRLITSLMGGFALLALLLACAGIYGVLSFVTARGTQEIGIRTAMGASRGDVILMVIGGGAIPVLAGIAVGLGGSMGLAQFIRSMLVTSPIDALTLVAVSALFLVVALAACFVHGVRRESIRCRPCGRSRACLRRSEPHGTFLTTCGDAVQGASV